MLNWGVNVFEKEGGNGYSISLQFPREEFSNDDIRAFFKMLKDMEDQVKADALKHSRDWFGKNTGMVLTLFGIPFSSILRIRRQVRQT